MQQAGPTEKISFKDLFIPLTTPKAIFWIIVLGILIYANMLFNSFIGDDFVQISNNILIHSITNIPYIFTQGPTYDTSGQINNYYKPILTTSFTILYAIFGENTFGYHFFQLILHIGNAILVYFLFRYFFKKELSFFLSIFFLLHPINTEAVVFISDLQDVMFLLFGLIALLLSIKKHHYTYLNYLIPILMLLSLLSKETGIVFFFIIPVFSVLFDRNQTLKRILQSLCAFIVYLTMRIGIAHIYFNNTIKIVPIQTVSFYQRMTTMPNIILFYIKTFFFPKDLLFYQSWIIQSINFKDFYLPIIFDCLFFILVIGFGFYLFNKAQKYFNQYIFFFLWFLIGLIVHLQFFPLDETVADRWFYFPIIGLLGILGTLFTYFNFQKYIKIVIPILILIVCIFSTRDIIRNANWNNQETLYTHDAKNNPNSYQLIMGLAIVNYDNHNYTTAQKDYFRAISLFPSLTTYSYLGAFYLDTYQPKEAEYAYTKALQYDPNFAITWEYLAVSQYEASNKKEAITSAEKAYSISPSNPYLYVLQHIQKNNLNVIRN